MADAEAVQGKGLASALDYLDANGQEREVRAVVGRYATILQRHEDGYLLDVTDFHGRPVKREHGLTREDVALRMLALQTASALLESIEAERLDSELAELGSGE